MSQDHVTSVLCKLTFSQESGVALQATVETLLRDSANAKYQYSYLFFYERNKGDLPLIPARGWGGGGLLGLMFGYVPLAFQSPYPIVYLLAGAHQMEPPSPLIS